MEGSHPSASFNTYHSEGGVILSKFTTTWRGCHALQETPNLFPYKQTQEEKPPLTDKPQLNRHRHEGW